MRFPSFRPVATFIGMAGMAAALVATPASAVIDPAHQFVTNGSFEQLSNGNYGELAYNGVGVVGWTSSPADNNGTRGYNFVMNTQNAKTGVQSEYGNGTLALWAQGNGGLNTLTASSTGGNFLAADGAFNNGLISQAVTGLIVGQSYQLKFDFAGAQQTGYTGSTTEAWYYGMASQGGNGTQLTNILNNQSKGFTGWTNETYNFVATSASDTLYFFARGTPDGQPPFVLLDSVSLVGAFGTVSAAPDPATWMMMLVGFGAIGFSLRRKRVATGAKAFAA